MKLKELYEIVSETDGLIWNCARCVFCTGKSSEDHLVFFFPNSTEPFFDFVHITEDNFEDCKYDSENSQVIMYKIKTTNTIYYLGVHK